MNLTSIHEVLGLKLGWAQWVKFLALLPFAVVWPLLWLWHRLAAAALIQPLAWELPYATGVALKRKKEKKRNNGLNFFFFFCLFRAAPMAYGGSQARG